MANEPKTGIVQTRLGPLPEDLFELEPKAKLRAQLALAHGIWRGAKDDQEGQNQRRYACQVALGAVLEYVKDDVPPEHTDLLVCLVECLGDLKLGRQPELMKPALQERPKRGNPGLLSGRAMTLATACAMVDVLSKDRGPTSSIKNIEAEVAEAIGEQPGAFRSRRKAFKVRSRRKAFKAGRKGQQAGEAYDGMLRMLREQPDPKQAARALLGTYKRARKP